MVHAFLIHTLHPRPGEEAGLCRVLYSRVFGSERPDQSPEQPGPHDLEKERLGRKEQILAVARAPRTGGQDPGSVSATENQLACRRRHACHRLPTPDLQPASSCCQADLPEMFRSCFLFLIASVYKMTVILSLPLFLAFPRQVDSACKLLHQASGRPASDFPIQLPDEPISLQDAPSGVFRLPPGDPFCENKTVLWLGVLSLGFALVCDPQENLTLAENTLRLVVKYLLEHLKLLNQGSDVVLKADKTEIILSKFLPHGQLLFLNDQFVQGLEKELGACLAK
ncbi:AP-5 complex subunit sigma-1 isoform X1 [Chrysemys picta bellii]|uniref:AP-5 complex subunit sigma-1 isoform X1 n=1 Tax=Chrysemys picta bellii TaxID=8478 RepID=UPI0032B19867